MNINRQMIITNPVCLFLFCLLLNLKIDLQYQIVKLHFCAERMWAHFILLPAILQILTTIYYEPIFEFLMQTKHRKLLWRRVKSNSKMVKSIEGLIIICTTRSTIRFPRFLNKPIIEITQQWTEELRMKAHFIKHVQNGWILDK